MINQFFSKKSKLNRYELKYQEHLNNIKEDKENLKNISNVAILGTGAKATLAYGICRENQINIVCFISNSGYKEYLNKEVLPSNSLNNIQIDAIVYADGEKEFSATSFIDQRLIKLKTQLNNILDEKTDMKINSYRELNKEEIYTLLNTIRISIKSLFLLLKRHFFNSQKFRKTYVSIIDYEQQWSNNYENLFIPIKPWYDIRKYEKVVHDDWTNVELQRNTIVKRVAQNIRKNNHKKVLEVGSGGGLNLIMLASEFPDVKFIGLEPTANGIAQTKKNMEEIDYRLVQDKSIQKLDNVTLLYDSILNKKLIQELKKENIDLVYTHAVLEQVQQYLPNVFNNLFNINAKFWLLDEPWKEGNSPQRYFNLIKKDYFRIPYNYIDTYDGVSIIEWHPQNLQCGLQDYSTLLIKRDESC